MPKASAPDGLTDKQRRFVEEYLIDLNATQAAIRAGYKPTNAQETGTENLQKPIVKAAIDRLKAERSVKTLIEGEKVVKALCAIAFIDRRKIAKWGPDGIEFKPCGELTEEEASLVESFSQTRTQHGGTIRVELASRLTALKLLGDHLGLFDDLKRMKEELEEMKKLVYGSGSKK